MKWISTRNSKMKVSFMEAMEMGLSSDGGLFMPESFPTVSAEELSQFRDISFPDMAVRLAKKWLCPEIDEKRVEAKTRAALNFPITLHPLSENYSVLELFHGPSLSFKDFGARFLAQFLGGKKKKPRVVLTATSGDTGSAVAHGFFGSLGVQVVLLYPSGGVSLLQEKQMTTLGKNITALEVEGTFDDCQNLVRQAFQDPKLSDLRLTSANSINVGRLLPQSFYYFYAASRMKTAGKLACVVPSGNLGNLTAGIFAKKMGCPIHLFIAATNRNNPLQSAPKRAVKTLSNAMDVGNPSNLERLTFLLDKNKITSQSISDEGTKAAIQQVSGQYGYLIDPHTAVGWAAWQQLQLKGYDFVLFLATAHPAKFAQTVFEVTGLHPEMPKSLQTVMKKKKKSLPLSAHYPDFAEWLRKNISDEGREK